jgi:predicted nucleic acid-binding protein
MILVDANLLVYAHVRSFQQYEGARAWLDAQLNGNSLVGLAWHSLLAFFTLLPILGC